MPSGTSRSCTTSFSRERSCAEVILRLMPPPRAVLGIKHRIAAGQRQIGRQRRALVAALFLDDLHQHHLAALDDFLDLVLTARTEGALRHLFHDVVAADGFDDFLLGLVAVVFIVVILVAMRGDGLSVVIRCGGLAAGVFGVLAAVFACRVVGMGGVFVRVLVAWACSSSVRLRELPPASEPRRRPYRAGSPRPASRWRGFRCPDPAHGRARHGHAAWS